MGAVSTLIIGSGTPGNYAPAQVTSNEQTAGFDTSTATELILYFQIGVATPSGNIQPSLQLTIQTSPDGGTTWFPISAISQVQYLTEPATLVIPVPAPFGNMMRVASLFVSGTWPILAWAVMK